MAYTRFSLRAVVLFVFIAICEVSANGDALKVKKHRKRGHCHPHSPVSSTVLSLSSALPTSISSSTFETSLIISASISASLSTAVSDSSVPFETTTSVPSSSPGFPSIASSEPVPASSSAKSPFPSLPISTSSSPLPSTSEGPSSTSESSVVVTSSLAAPCEPTVATWAPELCWRSVPARCSSMTVTTFLAPTQTAHINACHTALRVYGNQLASQVSDCFDNMGQPNFNPTSAFGCISSASIVCQATSACAPAATSTPIIPAYENGGFEFGSLGSWAEIPAATPGNLVGEITNERAHTGSHSLKLQFNNLADDFIAWEHRVRFEPGGRYEFSFWYYSLSNLSYGTLSIKADYPGSGLQLVVGMTSQVAGKWHQQKFTVTPSASFGTVSVTYLSTKGNVGNTIYIDDVTVTKVG